MINFQRLYVGTGATLIFLLGFTVFIGIWFSLGMPIEPRYGYWGAGLLGLTWLGFIVSLGFNSTEVECAYAREKLLADFTRRLYSGSNLYEDVVGTFLAERILNEIKQNPNGYLPFIAGLDPASRIVLMQYCAREDARLKKLMEQAFTNKREVDDTHAEACRINTIREDWQAIHRLLQLK